MMIDPANVKRIGDRVQRLARHGKVKSKHMQPAEFTAIRERLGLSKAALGRLFRTSRNTIINLEAGPKRGIPAVYEIAMRALDQGFRTGVDLPTSEKAPK